MPNALQFGNHWYLQNKMKGIQDVRQAEKWDFKAFRSKYGMHFSGNFMYMLTICLNASSNMKHI